MSAAVQQREPVPLLPLAAALVLCALYWPILTTDIDLSYVPWLRHIAAVGPASALGTPFGDYTPPYYYLLSLLSLGYGTLPEVSLVKLAGVLATAFLALAVHRLFGALQVSAPIRATAYLLLLPGVMFNAAVFASCDALWAGACVAAVTMAVEHRHRSMLVWCGVAFAIKAQAIFAAPFFLGLLLARRVPFRYWLVMPGAMLALYLPAMILGWPVGDLLTVYFRQAGFFERLSLNAPNIWAAIQLIPGADALWLGRIANAAAVAASLGLVALIARKRLGGPMLLAAGTLSVLLAAGLLPRMHERYFFLADVLAFTFAVACGTRSAWVSAGLVQLGTALGIAAYVTQMPWIAAVGAVPMLLATWRFAKVVRTAPARDDSPAATSPVVLAGS